MPKTDHRIYMMKAHAINIDLPFTGIAENRTRLAHPTRYPITNVQCYISAGL